MISPKRFDIFPPDCWGVLRRSRRDRFFLKKIVIVVVVIVVDSHIQRIILVTEETTVTQQVSHRPINADPACGQKYLPRSTNHIMVTTRYSDQHESKSRQKVMRLYKQWHRPVSKWFIKSPYSISRAASIDSDCCRLPTTSGLSQQQNGQITLQPVLINMSKFLKATLRTKIRKIEIPRSMLVEALSR